MKRVVKILKVSALILFILLMSIDTTFSGGDPKIAPDLYAVLDSDQPVGIVIYLADQPAGALTQPILERYQPELERLRARLAETTPRLELGRPLTRAEETELVRQLRLPTAENLAARQAILTEITTVKQRMRGEMVAAIQARTASEQEGLCQFITAGGSEVIYQYSVMNALAAHVLGSRIRDIAARSDVAYVDASGKDTLLLDNSADAIRAFIWWDNGQYGTGRVGIIDSGIDANHPALNTHSFVQAVFHQFAQQEDRPYYQDDPTNPDDFIGHGTHIAGIVTSTAPPYRGVAYGLPDIVNAKIVYRRNDPQEPYGIRRPDAMAAANWAVATAAVDALNYSAGSVITTNYNSYAAFYDSIVDAFGVPVCAAAGNSGPAMYTIDSPSLGYNIISVAAMDDKNTSWRWDDEIASFSSRGPTLQEGRKKPDLAAPGVRIRSCSSEWESGDDFFNDDGTSFAAPHVTGALHLLFGAGVHDAKACKAVLINTAEDRGRPGWDEAYGWGYLDLEHAFMHRDDYFTGSVTPGGVVFYQGFGMVNGDKATLVWNRHVGYNGPNYPTVMYNLSDLDLDLYDGNTNGGIDWSLSGVDNVEQVAARANYDRVVVKVRAYSTSFEGVSQEPYALATEEYFSSATPPALQLTPWGTNPQYANPGGTITLGYTVQNTGGLRAFNVTLYIYLPTGWGTLPPQNMGILEPGASANVSWQVWVASPGPQVIRINAHSMSYGEEYLTPSQHLLNPLRVYLPLAMKGYAAVGLKGPAAPATPTPARDAYPPPALSPAPVVPAPLAATATPGAYPPPPATATSTPRPPKPTPTRIPTYTATPTRNR